MRFSITKPELTTQLLPILIPSLIIVPLPIKVLLPTDTSPFRIARLIYDNDYQL